MGQRTVVVIAGGERALVAVSDLPEGALVIAADSGVDYAHELDLHVDIAIGDFDSVTSRGLSKATDRGARVDAHPAAKDMTDLELALDEAMRAGATDLLVFGVGGGRLDHLMANLLVLASPRFAPCRITAFAGRARVHVVRGGEEPTTIDAAVGELLTILPVGGPAAGITTTGLEYPLRREPLAAGSTRGVSNVVAEPSPTVQLDEGTVLVVLPREGDL